MVNGATQKKLELQKQVFRKVRFHAKHATQTFWGEGLRMSFAARRTTKHTASTAPWRRLRLFRAAPAPGAVEEPLIHPCGGHATAEAHWSAFPEQRSRARAYPEGHPRRRWFRDEPKRRKYSDRRRCRTDFHH